MSYTTTDLLRSIKVKGQIPTSQQTFSTTDLLALADDESDIGIVPHIMSVRESYFQTSKDTSVSDGTARYRINPRAIGLKLKELHLIDSAGNAHDVERKEVEERPYLSTGSGNSIEGFYFEGSEFVLVPTPSGMSDWSIRQYFFRRPGRLVQTSACGQITAINTATRQVTISSTPSTFTTSQTYDFIQANPGFDTLAMDQAISAVGSNILTFSSELPSSLAVGDWVALAGQTPVVQLPPEFHPILALRVAITVLRSLGHEKEADSKQKELDKIEETVLGLINPRIEGEPKKIISRNGVLSPNGQVNRLLKY